MRWLDVQLNGYEFEQAFGEGKGQGGLACWSSWGRKELDTTERLKNSNNWYIYHLLGFYLDKISPLSGLSSLCWPLIIHLSLEGRLSCTFLQAESLHFLSHPKPCMYLPPSGSGTVVLSRKAGRPRRWLAEVPWPPRTVEAHGTSSTGKKEKGNT